MTAERWKHVKPLFFEALALPPDERPAFLDATCGDDADLRDELLGLLAADEQVQDDGFMDRAAPDLLPELSPEASFEGRTIGAYTLLREIGHGGMGAVYLAVRRAPFKQYVALKLVRGGYDMHEAVQRFEMERQILASLSHPNIARLLDGGTTDDGLAFFAMEYIDGERITDYCDTQRLPLPRRLKLFQDVCHAVHYAHQNLVVHRDLKPSNILVTEPVPAQAGNERVKLLDFGVAKLLNPHLSNLQVPITRTMFRMMTPEYASPEQVRGETLTTASDIYALGVLLYELLTGHRPHQITSSSPQEIERIVCEQDPERPSTVVAKTEGAPTGGDTAPTITPETISQARGTTPDRLRRRLRGDLDNIVLKAMRKEPARRYASAEQLAADLGRYLAGTPVLARKPTVAYRVQKFVRRHRAGTAMTAALLVLLIAVGTLYAVRVTAERDRAQQAAAQAEQVTDFMVSVFQGSDPEEAKGDMITARELLERGVARIDVELRDQPLVKARMNDVMGQVYQSLGRFDQAQPLLEAALATRRALLGDTHLEVAQSLGHLASLHQDTKALDEAEALAREALTIQQAHLAPDHPDLAQTLHNLATIQSERDAYTEADSLLRVALAIRREVLGPTHPKTIGTLYELGLTLHIQGERDEARQLIKDAATALAQRPAEPHPDAVQSLDQVALMLRFQGAYAEAERLYHEMHRITRALYGETHPQVANALYLLGEVLRPQGNPDDAARYSRQALAMRRTLFGDVSRPVAYSLRQLGNIAASKEDYEEAITLFREDLAVFQALEGDDASDTAQRKVQLARALRLHGQPAEIEALLGSALPVLEQTDDLGNQNIYAVGLKEWSYTLLERGQTAQAERLLRDALAILEKSYPRSYSPAIPEIESMLGACLTAQGRYADAETLLQAAYETFKEQAASDGTRSLPLNIRLTRQTLGWLVALYQTWAKPDEAARHQALLNALNDSP